MTCNFPLTAYFTRDDAGNRGVTFSRNASLSGAPLRLPCGQCTGCRLDRSRQWAMRCMHERRMHDVASFVTLTYEKMPKDCSLNKRDLQLFNKRLREAVGKFRFYACGEYGERLGRPHYHSILFGLDFADKKKWKKNGRGEQLYTSDVLERTWSHGFCSIGDVSFDSCAYVARYCMAKVLGDKAAAHYGKRIPEFCLMSRRPGIGFAYYGKYGDEVYAHDSVICNGVEVAPPRYYDGKYELVDAAHLERLKVVRRQEARKFRADNTPDRRKVREKVMIAKLNLHRREI